MTTFLTLFASFFGAWAFFKYIVLVDMRIDSNTYKTLYDLCKDEKKIMIYEEFVSEKRHPVAYVAFCFFKKAPWFYLNHSERLMTAGFHEKDFITVITCFRWNYRKVKNFLNTKIKEMQLHTLGVPVTLMLPYGTDKIGSLKEAFPEPIINESLWKDFEAEVEEVIGEKRLKTSALLYGSPGNGKSFFVKYLATKYRIPITIFTLDPDWNNHDLLLMFAQIPNKSIVLFEDFDNYFDKRQCLIPADKIKFTYDIILNGLDGCYTTHENVVFIMTVNDIEKVDEALKNRPSRFKFVRNFGNPDYETRLRVLGNEDSAAETDGMSLDQLFKYKSQMNR